MRHELVFEGEGDMADVEFTPDGDLSTPHVFDWCAPGRSQKQHARCRAWYVTRRDINDGRGRPNYVDVVVACECPTCRHPAPPAQPTQGDTSC